MARLLSAFLFLATLLAAGCVGGKPMAAEPNETHADPLAPQDAQVSTERGAISGTVIDEQIQPVPNATVQLETSDAKPTVLANATTDASGTFTFSLLKAGAYRVRASAKGFSDAAALAVVTAGSVTRSQLTMSQRPTEAPYVELKVFNGLTGCDSSGAVVTFFVLGGICPTQATESPGYSRNYTSDWKYAVWEATWSSPDEILGFLISSSDLTCDEAACFGVTVGPPALRLEGEPGKKMQNETSFYNSPTGGIAPFPDGAFKTNVGVYYGGQFGRETTNAVKPTGYCPNYCYGVATTLELRFSIYESVFHFAPPPDPKSYTALPDQ